MALSQCAFCGKLFNDAMGKECMECKGILDDAFVKVRAYLYASKEPVTAPEIVEKLGVSEKVLDYLIKQNRIILNGSAPGSSRKCRVCGAPTTGAQLCEACSAKFNSSVRENNPPEKKQQPGRSSAGSQPMATWGKR